MTKKTKIAKKVQSKAINPATLEDPQSRSEAFLHFINGTGRITFDQLPKPQSRVEWLLYYLCEKINAGNIGGGGGGQAPTEYIKTASYDANTETLTLTKQDNTTVELDLTPYVKNWEDLSDTHKLANINLFNPLEVIYDELYDSGNGDIESSTGWARVSVDVTGGETYTIIKNAHDSVTHVYLDSDGNVLQRVTNNGSEENGRRKYVISVPQQAGTVPTPVAKLGFNIYPNSKDTIEDIMVFKGDITVPNQTIPFTNNADIIIDGSKVSMAFDNRGTNLVSQTVAGAINELDNKCEGSLKTWGDLEDVIEYPYENLLDVSKRVEGGYYEDDGSITPSPTWSTVKVPVEPSTAYTLLRKDNTGSACRRVIYLDADGNRIDNYYSDNNPSNSVYHYYTFTTPQDCVYIGLSLPHSTTSGLTAMIIEDDVSTYTGNQIPFADGELIQIGTEVSYAFDNSNSNLVSTTYNSAIKEVNEKINIRPKKSFVICVAGQSNAVGYDESPVTEYSSKNLNPNRLRQLGIYENENLENIPLGHHAHSFQDMRSFTNPANPNLRGPKGIHLPLGNLLLNEVPEDYEIVFVSATHGDTGFTKGNTGNYVQGTMKPATLAGQRWGADSPYFLAMRDRIKHMLDKNEENIFGGVIWIQGEADYTNATDHEIGFTAMTNEFFRYFNTEGNQKYKSRVAKKEWGRHLWYNVDTTYWWYTQNKTQDIWDFYKRWNSDTYVEIPRDTDTNAINGTYRSSVHTSSNPPSHFGNDAYTKVIAPRVLAKMKENNGLFGNDIKCSEKPVEEWIDLNDVTETYSFYNNYNDRIEMHSNYIHSNGNITQNHREHWRAVIIPVVSGKTYYLYNKYTDRADMAAMVGSNSVVYYNTNKNIFDTSTRVSSTRLTTITQIGGKNVVEFVAPPGVTHIGMNFFVGTASGVNYVDSMTEVVLCEKEYITTTTLPADYIPHKIVTKTNINGDKVTINYGSVIGNTGKTELKEVLEVLASRQVGGGNASGITSINDFTPNNGRVKLGLAIEGSNLKLKAQGTDVADLTFYETIDGDNLVNGLSI